MLSPGTRLGPYTIVELIAVGGMGEVYRALDERLHRDVAVKVLPERFAGDRQSLDRFRHEARSVAALSHPNIVSLYDIGSEGDVHYVVTELLEGETLRRRLERGALAPHDALEMMLAICEGVAAAHASGIVHRDLKPENIFITKSGRVKVLDFGLARGAGALFARRGQQVTDVLPTEPGIVIGTVGYLAPEQIEGRTPTAATDVFSLGCVLYEMVAGRLPFVHDTAAAAMVALLHDRAPHLDDPALQDIDTLVQRCLEKDPAARPHDAGELVKELHLLLGGGRPTLRLRRMPALRARTIAMIAIVLLAMAAVLVFERMRDRQLDQGYDLRASDVRGDSETRRLVELALRADAQGDRAKAMELLEEAGRRSPQTALPAAFLASFEEAAGNNTNAEKWKSAATRRLRGASSYESLLARYLVAPSATAEKHALENAALELRPQAWRLRLAAAHFYLGHRDREAARRELMRIDVRKPDDRRLMLVLADRASLGDSDGALRDLRASRLRDRPAFYHYAEARIAWSRGDVKGARASFDRAANDAAAEGLAAAECESRELAGIALLRLGQLDEAQRRFATTTARARQFGIAARVFDSSAFAAYTAWRMHDADERDRRLRDAMSVAPPAQPAAALRLLAMRMGSNVWREWDVTPIASEVQLASVMTLIRAREAQLRGDAGTARRELRRARAEGIDTEEVREEAELLAAELGLPHQLLPPDPPYPNLLRYLAIFDLQSMSTSTGVSR